ncbi:DUF1120 domain-containing protein [Klebsiella michiganensis]|uniref:DUF1120 domain-containing protein n=1 Tax=Klebsiella michiganensis TaxID=1134687 RepID=UPI0032DA181E
MKKTLIAAALVLFTGSALAEQNAVLQVQGKLTAASCTPELSNGGEVDYGYIHLGSLSASEVNQIGEKDIDLKITCTAATKLAWTANDNRAETNAKVQVADYEAGGVDYYQFGVGKTEGGVNIGDYLMLTINSPIVDGVAAVIIARNSPTENWRGTAGLRSDGLTSMTVAAPGTVEPLAFTSAIIPITTKLAIQSTDILAITDDTQISGQATITLQYL